MSEELERLIADAIDLRREGLDETHRIRLYDIVAQAKAEATERVVAILRANAEERRARYNETVADVLDNLAAAIRGGGA